MGSPAIIEAGRNCTSHAPAHRVAFLVDGEAYFSALAAALRRAKQSVLVVGWDLHSEVRLRPGQPDGPSELNEVLQEITAANPGLDVRVLSWDFAPIYALEREFMPLLRVAWGLGSRVRLRLASDHPVGATHHQKLVVIDDALAFVGGLDLTINRWDTREHAVDNPLRTLPGGGTYGPFHDAQLAVDGEAAAALGKLARGRWTRATGEPLGAPTVESDPWPEGLAADLREVKVALARTEGEYQGAPAVKEIEALYLAAIAAARRCIYIENQYLTAGSIGDALCRRLEEPDGPEVIIVTPHALHGRLERLTMGLLRHRLVARLHQADRHQRLRLLSPVVGGQAQVGVHVHAKLLVVDDRLVSVGSANLCNRSMALDTECDAAIESGGEPEVARGIERFRDGLLAEHLGVGEAEVREAIAARGSVRAAIAALQGGPRTLIPLDEELDPETEPLLPVAQLVDATEPIDEALARRALPEEAAEEGRKGLPRAVLLLVVALGLAAAWAWTPLSDWAHPTNLAALAEPLRAHPLGPVLWLGLFVVGTLLVVPVVLLIVVTVLLFGPVVGFVTALLGSLLGGCAGYGLGRLLLRDTVRRLSGKRLDRITRALARRGLWAMAVVRVVPLAPFTVVNLVAGSSRIRLKDFLLGTLLGMTPGILMLALAADRVVAAAKDPSPLAVGLAVGAVAAVALLMRGLGRLLERISGRPKPEAGAAS